MSDSSRIVEKLWSFCNVLPDDGLSSLDYLEQLRAPKTSSSIVGVAQIEEAESIAQRHALTSIEARQESLLPMGSLAFARILPECANNVVQRCAMRG